ncbi:MAG: hypothetical protein JWM11_1647, partial [Planctomycetaceae bacterium]|nr:hypothetical protein [Planctomycetaceae bacterium]
PAISRITIQPAALELRGVRAQHGLLVTAEMKNGQLRDVTREAAYVVKQAELLKVESSGQCIPLHDGLTEVTVNFGGASASIPVTISGLQEPRPPSFKQEIIPLFTKFGCNQGACHGKQAGQNGFRLSLRGYAPEQDHEWNTREFLGRRISRTIPDDSLILRKPLGQMPHAGGRLFSENSRAHHLLRAWIETNLPGIVPDEPQAVKLQVLPGSRTLVTGQTQSMLALAQFSDGSIRDVTWLSQFFSNDESVLEVLPGAIVKALRPGETAVRVHFQQLVEVQIFTIPHDTPAPPEMFASRNNALDEHVFNKLKQLQIPPATLCDDATFLRRVMLDTLGTLPTAEEIRKFMGDPATDKRSKLIDSILQRPEFVDYWTLQFSDMLQNRKERDHDVRGDKGVRSLHAWLRTQVAANRPWNELAAAVLTATGDSFKNPAVGYYIVTIGEKRQAEQSEVVDSIAQAFLGTRIGCARCHNHPLEKYTQDDYYHFAGFFSRVWLDRKEPKDGPTLLSIGNEHINNLNRELKDSEQRLIQTQAAVTGKQGDELKQAESKVTEIQRHLEGLKKRIAEAQQQPVGVGQPRTGKFVAARPLDRSETTIAAGQDPRVLLAAWMTRPENESFSGSLVNRLWRHFLGVGLVEPVDDLRASNPPSNPELWKLLNHEFVSHGFDVRHVIKLILNSRTYQLSAVTAAANESDRRFYSHYYARRLPAEVLLDAISQATGVPEPFQGYPLGMRAIQLPDPRVNSYFLSLFGRSERVTACACERSGDVTLPQLLHLQNGDFLNRKVYSQENRMASLLKEIPDDAKVLEELYLLTLGRVPMDAERAVVLETLKSTSRDALFRDVLWALLNTKEFAFNH